MTEYTPEKVADLIAEARSRVHAHREFSRRMGGQGLKLSELYEDHAAMADALEATAAELRMRTWQLEDAEAVREDNARLAEDAEAERDEALAVIAEVKEYIINDTLLDLSDRMPGRIILDILSRIPEHPKED